MTKIEQMRLAGPCKAMRVVSFGNFDEHFIEELTRFCAGKRVLEVFAGNGLLAGLLAQGGVNVRATSKFSSIDGHGDGMLHPVEEIDAVSAVRLYEDVSDVLLMSWPTTTEAAADAVIAWGSERDVIFIGEMTRPELGRGGLGGCATDRLFAITTVGQSFQSYRGRGHLERAVTLRLEAKRVDRYPHGFCFSHIG